MISILVEIFLVAFFANLLYELAHSLLYKTCLEMPVKKYVPLIAKASVYDSIWVVLIYLITFVFFRNKNIFDNYFQLISFSVLSIISAYLWELYSTKHKRWEYSSKMPLIFGAGLTPTFQIFLTGTLSLYLVFIYG